MEQKKTKVGSRFLKCYLWFAVIIAISGLFGLIKNGLLFFAQNNLFYYWMIMYLLTIIGIISIAYDFIVFFAFRIFFKKNYDRLIMTIPIIDLSLIICGLLISSSIYFHFLSPIIYRVYYYIAIILNIGIIFLGIYILNTYKFEKKKQWSNRTKVFTLSIFILICILLLTAYFKIKNSSMEGFTGALLLIGTIYLIVYTYKRAREGTI